MVSIMSKFHQLQASISEAQKWSPLVDLETSQDYFPVFPAQSIVKGFRIGNRSPSDVEIGVAIASQSSGTYPAPPISARSLLLYRYPLVSGVTVHFPDTVILPSGCSFYVFVTGTSIQVTVQAPAMQTS